MSQTFQLEELDDATRGYLATAKENRAAGLPGVFLEASSNRPAAALFCGLAVVVGAVLATFPSTEDETRTALLQTAGLVLGGWLILYAFRVWAARARGTNLGTFWYADPNYFWLVDNSTVTVVPVGSLRHVKAVHVAAENSLLFNVAIGTGAETYRNPNRQPEPAALFVDFLNVLGVLRRDYSEIASTMTPAQLGNSALKIAREGRFTEVIDRSGGGLMDAIPHPLKANSATSGLPMMAVILALFVGGFFGLRSLNVTLRDDAAFAQAQSGGPLGLREYLFDARNTLHREEAEAQLDKAFERAIQTLRNKPEPDVDRASADAFASVLKQIRADRKCLLAVCATEIPNPQIPSNLVDVAAAPGREAEIAKKIEDKIVMALEPPGLVGLYETREPERSHLEFTWKFLPPDDAFGPRVEWTLVLRAEVGGQPILKTTMIYRGANAFATSESDVLRACAADVFRKVLGTTLDKPFIPPEDNG